MHSVVHFVDGQ